MLDEPVPQAFFKISDPRNELLFTADAARKAFEHVELPSNDEEELAQVRKQLDAAIHVMQQREERLSNIFIWGAALVMLTAFVIAVLAIVFMR